MLELFCLLCKLVKFFITGSKINGINVKLVRLLIIKKNYERNDKTYGLENMGTQFLYFEKLIDRID